MEELNDCWMTMPDEELSAIYRKRLKEQKRLARMTFIPLLPALVIYGFIGEEKKYPDTKPTQIE